jgi:hypothetical protein
MNPDPRNLNYRQRLAMAWPDERPFGTPVNRQPAPAAPAPAPAAPAAEAPTAPTALDLARKQGARELQLAAAEAAWPDDMVVSKGQDDVDHEAARAQELAEIEQDLAVLNRRKERLIKTGQS